MNDYSWTKNTQHILTAEKLEAVRVHLETIGFVAVLHWHYCGGRSPTALAFNDFDKYVLYLSTETEAGDAIDVWPFPTHEQPPFVEGKIANENGETPVGGAY